MRRRNGAGGELQIHPPPQGRRPVQGTPVPRSFVEDDLAGFAIGGFDGVDDAGAVVGADDDAVEENEDGEGEVEVEQRLGRGELDDLALLPEAVVAAAAEFGEARLEGLGDAASRLR